MHDASLVTSANRRMGKRKKRLELIHTNFHTGRKKWMCALDSRQLEKVLFISVESVRAELFLVGKAEVNHEDLVKVGNLQFACQNHREYRIRIPPLGRTTTTPAITNATM